MKYKEPQRQKERISHKKAQNHKLLCLFVANSLFASLWFVPRPQPSLRFEVTNQFPSVSGRLFVVIAKSDRPEPRNTIGDAGPEASTIVARDVKNFGPGVVTTLDKAAATFPVQSLDDLPPGDYYVQALLASNRDLKSVGAPGNLYSTIQRIHFRRKTSLSSISRFNLAF